MMVVGSKRIKLCKTRHFVWMEVFGILVASEYKKSNLVSAFSFFLLLCSLITFIKLQVIFADSLLEVAGFHGAEETDMWTYAWTDVSM